MFVSSVSKLQFIDDPHAAVTSFAAWWRFPQLKDSCTSASFHRRWHIWNNEVWPSETAFSTANILTQFKKVPTKIAVILRSFSETSSYVWTKCNPLAPISRFQIRQPVFISLCLCHLSRNSGLYPNCCATVLSHWFSFVLQPFAVQALAGSTSNCWSTKMWLNSPDADTETRPCKTVYSVTYVFVCNN